MDSMKLLMLFTWMIVMYTLSCKGQKQLCAPPNASAFAELSTDRYVVGSSVYYSCNINYFRQPGASSRFTCSNNSGHVDWAYDKYATQFKCTRQSNDVDQRTRKSTTGPLDSENEENSLVLEGYCAPKSINHARINIAKGTYPVGQELHYRCNTACTKWLELSGVMKCVHCNGKIFWDKVDSECIDTGTLEVPSTTIAIGNRHERVLDIEDLPSATRANPISVISYIGGVGSIPLVVLIFISNA
ncbi:hypothetical protein NDU88_003388 [Pleurodeles waltl]|uniref:Interleukin-2 receptor subunit alpha n=2 Tax=Pleurodeles waltl TaxID=8319 RepID=A0AAV7SEJ6_PLEWA|nr:hypothetical protein NDU88_003388 [Pleurodeles waltl]